jgi:glycine oxidase
MAGAEVHVIGAGVVGLSCAWQLARDGHEVTVVGTEPGRGGAGWVAAGMLAPVNEVQYGESTLTELRLHSARLWPAFAAALQDAAGSAFGYDTAGTVTVALDASDRAVLDDLLDYQHSLGLEAERRSAAECRRLVPALSPALRGGIEVPGDHHVDNRAFLAALVAACRAAGVSFVEAEVAAVEPGVHGSVLVLADPDARRLGAECVLLAAGTGLPAIAGLAEAGLPEVRPVKGHVLRLGPSPTAPPAATLLPMTVRGLVHGRGVYLVPRPDGSVVVGATVEERGLDTSVQAGAVHELLCDARAIVPGLDELVLLEASTGLRPATPDNLPRIGWTALPGVAVATGHFRNGILLAPLTAAAVADLVGGRPLSPLLDAVAPVPA